MPYPWQELGHLKGLKSILRCQLHAGQGGLEKALQSDDSCQELVKNLITAYSPSDDDGDMGSLARAMKNSHKLRQMFHKASASAVENLEAKLQTLVSFRYAPQRFNSVLEIAQLVVLHVRPLIHTLVQIKITEPKKVKWCERMLRFFTGPKLLLLAMIAELAASAARYNHRYDNVGGQPTQVSRSAYWYATLADELERLFGFSQGEPLVLAPQYSKGFVGILRSSYDVLVDESVVTGGHLQFYRSGLRTEDNLRKRIAAELGSTQNVVKIYLAALHPGDHSVASALRPFDTEHWLENFSDECLLKPQLET